MSLKRVVAKFLFSDRIIIVRYLIMCLRYGVSMKKFISLIFLVLIGTMLNAQEQPNGDEVRELEEVLQRARIAGAELANHLNDRNVGGDNQPVHGDLLIPGADEHRNDLGVVPFANDEEIVDLEISIRIHALRTRSYGKNNPPIQISDEAADSIIQMLSKNPDERPTVGSLLDLPIFHAQHSDDE